MSIKRDTILISAITGLALILRLWQINSDLWLDEIITIVRYMRLSPFEALLTFHSANQHLLNSVLGSISIHVFGESVWAVRLSALLFGVATIPAFFLLARLVTERREAIVATLFLTLSYHHVWFTQNARGYSGMIFFTVLSTFFLIRWLGGPEKAGRRDLLWFSLSGVLGMMSLLSFAFIPVGQFLIALIQLLKSRNWSALRLLISSGVLMVALTLLGYAATIPSIRSYFLGDSEDNFLGGSGGISQNLASFSSQLEAGWKMLLDGLIIALPAMAIPALLIGVVIALTGWVSYLQRMRFIAWILVLPSLFNILLLAQLNWIVFPRSFLYILPFGILVLVRGAFVMSDWAVRRSGSPGWGVHVLPVLMLIACAVTLPFNYKYPKQNYTGSLAYTRALAGPDDVIAVVGYLEYGYRYLYDPELVFPQSVQELEALRGPDHRLWVLNSFTMDMKMRLPDIRDYLKQEFQLEQVFPGTLGDGNVYLRVSPEQAEP